MSDSHNSRRPTLRAQLLWRLLPAVLILMALVFRRTAPHTPAYEEPVHVFVDADGSTHLEPAGNAGADTTLT